MRCLVPIISLLVALVLISVVRSSKLSIFNGKSATRNQFPYQVSIQNIPHDVFNHLCGGSIIAPAWILTAAHCVYPFDPDNLQVVAGILLLSDQDVPGEQILGVERIISHPKYTPVMPVSSYDVALLKLNASLTFSGDNVKPVDIPAPEAEYSGSAVVSGWGYDDNDNGQPDQLQYIELPLVSGADCLNIINQTDKIEQWFDVDLNICTGNDGKVQGPCLMDSGGPLVQNGTVIGTPSWYLDDCGNNTLSIYMKIAGFSDWITDQIKD